MCMYVSYKNPKNTIKNAQKSSKNFKPSIHNVVGFRSNFADKCGLFVCLLAVFMFTRYCDKMYNGHLFSYEGLVGYKSMISWPQLFKGRIILSTG